jgi:hypothetical protein
MIFVPLTNRNSYRQQSVEESSPYVDTNCRRTFTEDIKKKSSASTRDGEGKSWEKRR